MLSIAVILIVWFWGLTPTPINIIITVLMSIRFTYRFIRLWSEFRSSTSIDDKEE